MNEDEAKLAAMEQIPTLPHEAAAALLRAIIYDDKARADTGRTAMYLLARRALETSPPETRPSFERYLDAITNNRRVKRSTFEVHSSTVPVPQELIDEIEAALHGATEQGDNT